MVDVLSKMVDVLSRMVDDRSKQRHHITSYRGVLSLVVLVILVTHNMLIPFPSFTGTTDAMTLPGERKVSWTLNMFEMDLDTHRSICSKNRTIPPPNNTWPWYINNPDKQPSPLVDDSVKIKFLAYYFPQWFPDPRNGGGVNDWIFFQNPNFTHNANSLLIHRPLNHIYYDPRCLEHRRTQAALAKKYLLDGFLYYFYFPANEWLLSVVQQLMLSDGEPSIPFAFYWVNEAFAGRDALYEQPQIMANTLLPFVTHPSYITIHGRPVLYIYVASWVPSDYIRQLQDALVERGVPKLYVVAAIQNWHKQLVKVEFADAYAEFPPNIGEWRWKSHDYFRWDHTEDYHLSLNINFDNTARISGGNPQGLPTFLSKNRTLPENQPTPKEFQQRCIDRVRSWYGETKSEKVVTVFAWNEWSEQADLEPNDLDGYGYLEALRNCRMNVSNLEEPSHPPTS
jgi:Glycosyltransferase WbsX